MSRLGFYGWVRENVKRAVLLGVSDAVEVMGSADDKEELHARLVAVLQPAKPRLAAPMAASNDAPRGDRKKRLGRTLSELQPPANAKPA